MGRGWEGAQGSEEAKGGRKEKKLKKKLASQQLWPDEHAPPHSLPHCLVFPLQPHIMAVQNLYEYKYTQRDALCLDSVYPSPKCKHTEELLAILGANWHQITIKS